MHCFSSGNGQSSRALIFHRPVMFSFIQVTVLALIAGCSGRPSAIKPVEVDPSQAAAQAIRLYDKDSDSALAGAELDAVPGIQKHSKKYDQDGDGRITEQEIKDRIAGWKAQALGLRGLTVFVEMDGQPLPDATVLFEPEPYLGEVVHPATGITGPRGFTRVAISEEFLPEQLQGKHGAYITGGTFKIRVTHPTKKIPAKYNEQTTLGEEIAPDTVAAEVKVTLKSD
ncbi:MAG: hypothetical protein JW829_08940 [Pirellulales bacterium]|nr:hypothetical protein [Pirellulales bacterium]